MPRSHEGPLVVLHVGWDRQNLRLGLGDDVVLYGGLPHVRDCGSELSLERRRASIRVDG